MSLVLRAQLRFLWRVRWSMVSALLGMTIGVASVVGVHLLSARVESRVNQQSQPVGDVDLYLKKAGLTDADYFRLRARMRAGELPGVAALLPLIEGEVSINDEPHLLVGSDPLADTSIQLLSNPASVPERTTDQTTDQTTDLLRFLSSDAVYLARDLAESGNLKAITLRGQKVDVLGFTAPNGVVLADIPTARSILGLNLRPQLSSIGVRFTSQARNSGQALGLKRFAANLFPGALAEPPPARIAKLGSEWQQLAPADLNPTQQLLRSVLFNVAALSLLALVVAWLLTYQVACHALGRRQAMFDRLQSLGVSRGRLLWLTQVEGLVLGLVATGLGSVLGLLLSNLLLSLALGEVLTFPLVLSGFVAFKAIVSGMGVAGLSYWLAANRSLVTGVRLTGTPEKVSPRPLLALILLGIFVWGVLGNTLVGAFACIVVSALVLIIYLPRLVDWLWQKLITPARLLGRSSRLTLRTLGMRQVLIGSELRLGVSALALALATALGISIMVDSFRGAFLTMLDQRLADDLVVKLPAQDSPVSHGALEARLDALTESYFWRGNSVVSARGVRGRIEYADDYAELIRRFVEGSADVSPALELPDVYINESFARAQKLRPGAKLVLEGQQLGVNSELEVSGTEVVVAGIYKDFGEARPRILGARSLVQQLSDRAPLTELFLRTSDMAAVEEDLAEFVDDGRLGLQDQAQVRRRSIEVFEQTFAITRALTWLALLVAGVALANALAAHGLAQHGTSNRLHILGLSQAGESRLRRDRRVYVAGAAVLLALPFGILIAVLLCVLVNPIAFGWSFPVRLSVAGVGLPLLVGALGGLAAATLGDQLATQRLRVSTNRTAVFAVLLLVSVGLLGGCGFEPGAESANPGRPPSQGQKPPSANRATPALRVGQVLGGEAGGFARASKIVPFVFPRDHGAHPEYRSEWWYLTCPLRGAGGSEYGVQFTLFRQALTAPDEELGSREQQTSMWRTGQLYMAHAALTDVAQKQHVESSRLVRGHPSLAGVRAAPFSVWLEDWRLAEASGAQAAMTDSPVPGITVLALDVRSPEFRAELLLTPDKALVLQGDRGLSYKGSEEASYYYSLPRLSVTGSVMPPGADRASAVTGSCWLDREWSTSVLADNLAGWDWFALQLNDRSEFMLFQLRQKSGDEETQSTAQQKSRLKQGKYIAANGDAVTLDGSALKFLPTRYWRDETGALWPVEWTLQLMDRTLHVVAALDDQRMRSSIAYWEGLVWVFEGSAENKQRIGQGYLEMTGYTR